MGKITEYATTAAALANADLFDMSKDTLGTGAVYESQKVPQATIRSQFGVSGTSGYFTKYDSAGTKLDQTVMFQDTATENRIGINTLTPAAYFEVIRKTGLTTDKLVSFQNRLGGSNIGLVVDNNGGVRMGLTPDTMPAGAGHSVNVASQLHRFGASFSSGTTYGDINFEQSSALSVKWISGAGTGIKHYFDDTANVGELMFNIGGDKSFHFDIDTNRRFSIFEEGGIRPTELTTAERDAIGSPADGTLIWNTTTEQLELYFGGWTGLGGGGPTAISDLSDVDITGIATGDLIRWSGTELVPHKQAFLALTGGPGAWSWDYSAGYNRTVTLTQNATMTLTNIANGDYGTLKVVMGGSGSYTLGLPAGSKVVNGGLGTLTPSPAIGDIDVWTWVYDGTNTLWQRGPNFS